jgi:hypothetical protein
MSKISGKDLRKLGFEKQRERSTIATNLSEKYHYYTYEINKHCMLISWSNNEKTLDGGYTIEFYEIPEIRFDKLEDLKKLMKLLKRGEKNNAG